MVCPLLRSPSMKAISAAQRAKQAQRGRPCSGEGVPRARPSRTLRTANREGLPQAVLLLLFLLPHHSRSRSPPVFTSHLPLLHTRLCFPPASTLRHS